MSKRIYAAMAAIAAAAVLVPSAAFAAPLTTKQIKRAQTKLALLGFEVGPADGVVGPLTARAMCAYEIIAKFPAHLGTMNRKAYRKLMRIHRLRHAVQKERSYLSVSIRCQVIYQVRRHRYTRIIPASTGRAGYDSLGRPSFATRRGTWKIGVKVNGWQESNQYSGGWMYRPMYFSGGEAIHGEASASSVLPYFASHGCVRVFMADQDKLWRASPLGTVVHVF